MSECGKWVGKGTVNYPCALDAQHAGPCMARENAASIRERERWDKERLEEKALNLALDKALEQPPVVVPPVVETNVDAEEARQVLATMEEETAEVLAPTKQRPGDQPLPVVNDLPYIQDAVIADIEARKAVGIERYGTPLQAFNGRDAMVDAYEEALDLCMYLKQCIVERDAKAVSSAP